MCASVEYRGEYIVPSLRSRDNFSLAQGADFRIGTWPLSATLRLFRSVFETQFFGRFLGFHHAESTHTLLSMVYGYRKRVATRIIVCRIHHREKQIALVVVLTPGHIKARERASNSAHDIWWWVVYKTVRIAPGTSAFRPPLL